MSILAKSNWEPIELFTKFGNVIVFADSKDEPYADVGDTQVYLIAPPLSQGNNNRHNQELVVGVIVPTQL